jgi:hypothetical protein
VRRGGEGLGHGGTEARPGVGRRVAGRSGRGGGWLGRRRDGTRCGAGPVDNMGTAARGVQALRRQSDGVEAWWVSRWTEAERQPV